MKNKKAISMNKIDGKTWQEIWKGKGESGLERSRYDLKTLMALDGFDKLGSMPVESWKSLGKVIAEALELRNDDFVLEVGCGAGAMLLMIQGRSRVFGLDYSLPLLKVAKEVLANPGLVSGEAVCLPFKSGTFSAVFSNSVFHYFPDYEYARQVILEVIRVTKDNGRIFITDIPDISAKKRIESRRQELGLSYNNKYPGLQHLYYPHSFFKRIALNTGLKIRITEQDIKGYWYSNLKFNVLFRK